jgi:hypothetical protein
MALAGLKPVRRWTAAPEDHDIVIPWGAADLEVMYAAEEGGFLASQKVQTCGELHRKIQDMARDRSRIGWMVTRDFRELWLVKENDEASAEDPSEWHRATIARKEAGGFDRRYDAEVESGDDEDVTGTESAEEAKKPTAKQARKVAAKKAKTQG